MSGDQKMPAVIDPDSLFAAFSSIRNACDDGLQLIEEHRQNSAELQQSIGSLQNAVHRCQREISTLNQQINKPISGQPTGGQSKLRPFSDVAEEDEASMRKKQRVGSASTENDLINKTLEDDGQQLVRAKNYSHEEIQEHLNEFEVPCKIDPARLEIISKMALSSSRTAVLPIELWHSIFDLLELTDLPSCALVSRTLYRMVKAYRVREVAFTRRVYSWFYPEFSIYQHRVDYSMASLLNGSSFSLEYLKRLQIGRRSSINDLNVINKFTHLEELDIDLKNYKNEGSRTLSLAHLKVLCLFMSEHLPYLELDTPRLEKVCTFSLEKLDFLYPDSVRCIRTFFHSGKLCMFRSLECLLFTDRYNQMDYTNEHSSSSFNEFSLSPLKKLKEIDFFFGFRGLEKNNLAKIRKAIATILALGRPDLKVFWFDMQVTDSSLLTEYRESNVVLIASQLKHFEKLKDKVDFFWWHNFNVSMSLLTEAGFDLRSEEFTSKFLARFSFRRINVFGEVKEKELLIELIARTPRLWGLFFSNTNLEQSFFDRMADAVRLNGIPLRHLHFRNTSNESLSFDFVSTLRHLELFETDQPLPSELIPKLLRLPLISKIEFSSGEHRIERKSTGTLWLHVESLSLQLLVRSI